MRSFLHCRAAGKQGGAFKCVSPGEGADGAQRSYPRARFAPPAASPPMEIGRFFCNGEVQAKVLLGGAGDIGPVKAVKNIGEGLGGDARPGVGDL